MVTKSDGRGNGDSAQPEENPQAGATDNSPEPTTEPSLTEDGTDLGAREPEAAALPETSDVGTPADPDAPADPLVEAVVDTEADPRDLAELAALDGADGFLPEAAEGDAASTWETEPETAVADAETAVDGSGIAAGLEPPLDADRFAAPEAAAEPLSYATSHERDSGAIAHAAGEDPHDHDHDHEEHEEGSSLAAKALTALVLLLVGAGAGIWAAPRLAPALPSGLAPVSAWLQPGTADTSARIAALEAQLAESAKPADIAAAVDAARGGLETEITTLRDSVEAGGAGMLGERIGQLESALDGQRGELAALKGQLAGVPSDGASGTGAQIDVYRAELDGLRAEFDRLSGQVGSLSGRVEEVAATSTARVQEIEKTEGARADAAEVQADLASIRAALVAGLPFADQAARLEASGTALPEGLEAAASSGAPSLADLQARFPAAAHEAIRAAILASAGDGFLARARAYVEAQIASRSLSPQPGATPDAILSRMDDDLAKGDLAGVLTESTALPSEATAALSGWLEGVKARQAADAALATLGGAQPAVTE